MAWSKFIHWLQIWSAAIQQVFYSLSVGLCPIVVLSSHNKFNHPIYRWVTPPNSNCRYKEFNVLNQINVIKSTFLSHIYKKFMSRWNLWRTPAKLIVIVAANQSVFQCYHFNIAVFQKYINKHFLALTCLISILFCWVVF